MCYFNIVTIESSFSFWSHVTIPTPTFCGGGDAIFFFPWTFYWEEALLHLRDMFKVFVLVWFVSFQDSKWWVYSFCYCWLLGNFLLEETCVYLGMCTHVFYKIMWAKYMFVFCFFLRSWSPALPPTPRSFQGRCKKSLLSALKRSAGGNSKGLPCQDHRYCVYLEQPVLQLQRSARSTGSLASELTWEEEEEKGGNLFFLSSFLSF